MAAKPGLGRRLLINVAGPAVVTIVLLELLLRLLHPLNHPDEFRRHTLWREGSAYARHLLPPVGEVLEIDPDLARGGKRVEKPRHRYRINRLGFRGPELEIDKRPGTVRILVLGGSAAFDMEANDDEETTRDWPHLVERELADRGVTAVEVINAGVPGHSSVDSVSRLHAELWMLDPDLVVLYHGWNDIKDWHPDRIASGRPIARLRGPHVPERNPFTHTQGWLDALLCNSQVYRNARRYYWKQRLDVGGEGVASEAEFVSTTGDAGPAQFGFSLALFVDGVRRSGAEPVLVTQATLVTEDSPPEHRERVSYGYVKLTHEGLVDAFERSWRLIRETAEREGITLIDAAAELSGRGELFDDHVHTTPEGSRELARFVADRLHPLVIAARDAEHSSEAVAPPGVVD